MNTPNTAKKPNIIDILILLVVLLAIAAAVFRALHVKEFSDTVKDQPVVYTLHATDLDAAFARSVQPGDLLYLSGNALACGEVTEVTPTYSTKYVYYTNGTASEHLYPEQLNLDIAVSVSADVSENGFYIGEQTYFTRGKSLELHTQTFCFTATITDISHNIE